MRVFDTYKFNLADKVVFKATKPYIDDVMGKMGLSYKNIAFLLKDLSRDNVDRVLKKFPDLQRFEFHDNRTGMDDYGLSSIYECCNEEMYVPKEYEEDVFCVFSKIPRPFGFSFGNIIYSGIEWFEDSDDTISIVDWDRTDNTYWSHPAFMTNRIMQIREFDDGLKKNRVAVTIEVTAKDGIKDSRSVIEKLEPYFGKETEFVRECAFSKEEYDKNREIEKLLTEKFKKHGDSLLPKFPPRRHFKKSDDGIDIWFSPPILPDVANKKTTEKVFKNSKYKRVKGQPNWLHLYRSFDDNGYKYDIEIQKLSYSNEFRMSITISGYNFSVSYQHEDYEVEKEGESIVIIEKFRDFCENNLREFINELVENFGNTPEWFFAEQRTLWESGS